MNVLLHVCTCVSQKVALGALEFELGMVVSHLEFNPDPIQEQQKPVTAETSLQLLKSPLMSRVVQKGENEPRTHLLQFSFCLLIRCDQLPQPSVATTSLPRWTIFSNSGQN